MLQNQNKLCKCVKCDIDNCPFIYYIGYTHKIRLVYNIAEVGDIYKGKPRQKSVYSKGG